MLKFEGSWVDRVFDLILVFLGRFWVVFGSFLGSF